VNDHQYVRLLSVATAPFRLEQKKVSNCAAVRLWWWALMPIEPLKLCRVLVEFV
jgi:hypothetical protein